MDQSCWPSQFRLHLPGSFGANCTPADATVCSNRSPLGPRGRPKQRFLRNALNAPNKAALIYRQTKNLRAVQLLLGHTKLESTVRYPGIAVEDALGYPRRPKLEGPLSANSETTTLPSMPFICSPQSNAIG